MIISAYLPKGGVGKSTSTASLGYALSKHGKVLLIDGDPQGSLSRYLVPKDDFPQLNSGLYSLCVGDTDFTDSIYSVRAKGENNNEIDLIGTMPGKNKLAQYIEGEFRDDPIRLKLITKQAIKAGYKYILFDLPPDFRFYTKSVLQLCNQIIPVVLCEELPFGEFKTFMRKLIELKDAYECDYNVEYAIANNYNKDWMIHRQYYDVLKEKTPLKQVFICKKSAEIPNSSIANMFIQEFKSTNQCVQVFEDLAQLLINQDNKEI